MFNPESREVGGEASGSGVTLVRSFELLKRRLCAAKASIPKVTVSSRQK